jgi:hypothetical protein
VGAKPSINYDFETSRISLMKKLGFDVSNIEGNYPENATYFCPFARDIASKKMKEDLNKHREQIKENKSNYGYKYTGKRISMNWRLLSVLSAIIISGAVISLSFLPQLEKYAEVMRYLGATILGGIIMAIFGYIFNKHSITKSN